MRTKLQTTTQHLRHRWRYGSVRHSWICLLACAITTLAWTRAGAVGFYPVPIEPGFNLIANQLNNGGNTLNEVLPQVDQDVAVRLELPPDSNPLALMPVGEQ